MGLWIELYQGKKQSWIYMEELSKAQIAIVKEIEKLITSLRGGSEEQIWKKSFEKILALVDEFDLTKHKIWG